MKQIIANLVLVAAAVAFLTAPSALTLLALATATVGTWVPNRY